MDIVVASKNRGKLAEIEKLISPSQGINFFSLGDFQDIPEIEETGKTFEENALIKAGIVSSHTGKISLADDSGLVIDALGGRPGVYSARYGGSGLNDTDRCRLILEEMKEFPSSRSARFICVMALSVPGKVDFTSEGSVEGVIHTEMRGSGGFGYDPIFYIPELGKTMAEIPIEEKNRISHRAIALRKISERLKSI